MEQALKFARNVVKRGQWALQPNKDFLNNVLTGLEQNRARYGYYLCPCREGWGTRSGDKDIICPCHYAAQDIDEFGHCYCGLFMAVDAAAENREIGAIPDRRPDELYPD